MPWGFPWGLLWGYPLQTGVCGYGDEFDTLGGYGDHPDGYGHPGCVVAGVAAVNQNLFHDLGGETCVLRGVPGTFTTGVDLSVEVDGVAAYSGVSEQGYAVRASATGDQISFVVPNRFGVSGPVDVDVDDGTTVNTYTGVISICVYSHRTTVDLDKLRYPRHPYYLPIATPRT